jgi:hypothetical protein
MARIDGAPGRLCAGSLSLALAALLFFVAIAPAAERAKSAPEPEFKLKVFRVWASMTARDEPPPKLLAPHIEALKERSGGKAFRLEGEPTTRTLTAADPLLLELPNGYSARWEATANGETALRQSLVNPAREKSVVLLRTSPVITSLRKILRGDEFFVLLVEFEKRNVGSGVRGARAKEPEEKERPHEDHRLHRTPGEDRIRLDQETDENRANGVGRGKAHGASGSLRFQGALRGA